MQQHQGLQRRRFLGSWLEVESLDPQQPRNDTQQVERHRQHYGSRAIYQRQPFGRWRPCELHPHHVPQQIPYPLRHSSI